MVARAQFSRLSWLRFLHRSYSRTGRWGWLFSRRVRAFGWGVALTAPLTAVLGTDVKNSGVYLLFCCSCSLLIISFIWIWFRSAKVSAHRYLPEYGNIGEEVEYMVQIRNESRKKLNAMLFEEWPPHPHPDFETFAFTPEPGEEKRNIVDRNMLYYRWTWLQERERGFSAIEASDSPRELPPGESANIIFRFEPQHRGVIAFDELRVLLPDPIGLFQRCKKVTVPQGELVILPKLYSLSNFRISAQANPQQGEEASFSKTGQTGDFLHLREYRAGDALRTVDWKSWARTGIPVVREYEDETSSRYGLILDHSGNAGTEFEEAVSVAASFVAGIGSHECFLNLMFIGETCYQVATGNDRIGLRLSARILTESKLRTSQSHYHLSYLVK